MRTESDLKRSLIHEAATPEHRNRALGNHAARVGFPVIALLLMLAQGTKAESRDPLCPSGMWSPKLEFQLEKATYKETLAWLSGWSYALTELGRSEANRETPRYCLPPCRLVTGQPLLAILNNAFKGQTITSEQAAEALWIGVPIIYRCSKQ
jgi:hypothetical protein